jgi:sporulation protein YlmC with PRC-barrel domain
MKFKTAALAGAASLAIALAPAAFAAGASAQPSASQPTESSDRMGSAPTGAEIGAAKAGSTIQSTTGVQDKFTTQELASAVALAKVDKSAATLEAAKVDDRSGKVIGTVTEVKMDKMGKVSALHVDVGSFLGMGGRVVAVPVSKFSYIPSRNILIANLDKKYIESLPPVVMNGAPG